MKNYIQYGTNYWQLNLVPDFLPYLRVLERLKVRLTSKDVGEEGTWYFGLFHVLCHQILQTIKELPAFSQVFLLLSTCRSLS